MHYKTHIGLVDAHTESDGCADHVDVFHQELILCLGAEFGVQTGMIRSSLDVIDHQHLGDVFGSFAVLDIYNARLTGKFLFDDLDDLLDGALFFDLRANFVKEVVAVERRHEGAILRHVEVFQDILLHLGRCGSGERHDRHMTGYSIQHDTDTAVFRAEVVSPFRDTVRLVYRHERNMRVLEKLNVFFFGQGFRSHIEDLGTTICNVLFYLFHLHLCERRVQKVRYLIFIRVSTDAVYLIFHQGDQWADNDGRPWQHQGG